MDEEIVTLTIDGVEVKTKKGTTILQAAKESGIDIPTLCFLKDINEMGDCRMCRRAGSRTKEQTARRMEKPGGDRSGTVFL